MEAQGEACLVGQEGKGREAGEELPPMHCLSELAPQLPWLPI